MDRNHVMVGWNDAVRLESQLLGGNVTDVWVWGFRQTRIYLMESWINRKTIIRDILKKKPYPGVTFILFLQKILSKS